MITGSIFLTEPAAWEIAIRNLQEYKDISHRCLETTVNGGKQRYYKREKIMELKLNPSSS